MGKCIFNENWLPKDRYKHWLRRDSNNQVLEKDFSTSSPGKVLEKSLNFILENLYEPWQCHLLQEPINNGPSFLVLF